MPKEPPPPALIYEEPWPIDCLVPFGMRPRWLMDPETPPVPERVATAFITPPRPIRWFDSPPGLDFSPWSGGSTASGQNTSSSGGGSAGSPYSWGRHPTLSEAVSSAEGLCEPSLTKHMEADVNWEDYANFISINRTPPSYLRQLFPKAVRPMPRATVPSEGRTSSAETVAANPSANSTVSTPNFGQQRHLAGNWRQGARPRGRQHITSLRSDGPISRHGGADAARGRNMSARTSSLLKPPNNGNPHGLDPKEDAEIKVRFGISPNYCGNPALPANHSANIGDNENCAFWLINLPPDLTHHQLLGAIRGTGRIFACVINPPNPQDGHTTSAAKLVFFDLAAAHKFYAWAVRDRLIINGYRAHVTFNRVKSAQSDELPHHSRVLAIKGHPSVVNEKYLTAWFRQRLEFDVDEVITHFATGEIAHVEFRFGSYRCQAQSARSAMDRELIQAKGSDTPIWQLRFGVDPCSI